VTDIINNRIIEILPYGKDFLFVNKISFVDSNNIIAHFSFNKNSVFFGSHFKHLPVLPGVILIEMMGQCGMVAHLLFLQGVENFTGRFHPVLSHVEAEFISKVDYDEDLTVKGEKIYFRNGVLKSKVFLFNSHDELCAVLTAQIKIILDDKK
jgi:3-hydroxymyristoyl/3-hydroxydecanoyl-(acyl carrier protein) dehydratase